MVSIETRELNLRERKDAASVIQELSDRGELGPICSLNLEYTEIDDNTLDLLGKEATSLTYLNLNACQELTDCGLMSLAGNVTKLTNLGLYWNVKISDEGLQTICQSNTSLTSLRLSGCKRLTDFSVTSITSSCSFLTSLDLTRCPKITDAGLRTISSHSTLETLLLYACSGFGDDGVSALVGSLHNLPVLDLCGTGELTDEVWRNDFFSPDQVKLSLTQIDCGQGLTPCSTLSIPRLRKLNIGWCPKLTNKTLEALGKGCPALEYLYLLGNPSMDLDGLQSLAKGCTKMCGMDICGLRLPDRSMSAMLPLFPNLTTLAKLGQAPNYNDY